MWQHFTERARRAVFFAQEEVVKVGENFVNTEHLLLGLLRERDHVAGQILERLGVQPTEICREVERQVARGNGRLATDMQLTPRAKRVTDLAYDEARQLNNNYIGTEHLLLGFIREGEGLASQVLSQFGVDLERTRSEVRKIQEETRQAKSEPTPESEKGKVWFESSATKGELGVLRNTDGREQVEVAVSEEALAELREVVEARDHHGYRNLLGANRMRLLPAATEVKLLRASGEDIYVVRFLSGEHEGQTGWIFRGQFRRTGPDNRPFPPPEDPAPPSGGQ